MRPTRIDHVAVYVSDPARVAAALVARLPFRVLERSDEFLLVGRRPELGKITLFASEPGREPGRLERIGITIPSAVGMSTLHLGDRLVVELVPGLPGGDVDLADLVLRVPDPAASVQAWLELGFERVDDGGAEERVRLGTTSICLRAGFPAPTSRPLLNHVGLLVESVADARSLVEDAGFAVTRSVDAEHSRAIFVAGPDGVEVELIEQLPSFALA